MTTSPLPPSSKGNFHLHQLNSHCIKNSGVDFSARPFGINGICRNIDKMLEGPKK